MFALLQGDKFPDTILNSADSLQKPGPWNIFTTYVHKNLLITQPNALWSHTYYT